MSLELVYSDPTANPPLTDDQMDLERTALVCIQGGGQGVRRGNAATRLQRVKMELWEAMARGDEFVSIDRLLAVAEGDMIPDSVA